jgi:L-lactate dehydrogenase complex protein LldF
MCTTLPRVLITLMAIEKVLARFEDLAVMLQLLPRSSTGERMNPYTSLWTGVTPGDGPQEFHLVLLEGGRTDVPADEIGRQTLHCIRCSACLNVCPVKIDIPSVLVHLRGRVTREVAKGRLDPEKAAMSAVGRVFESRRRYEAAQRLGRLGRGPLTKLPATGPMAAWTASRDLPEIPAQSFREWWRERS